MKGEIERLEVEYNENISKEQTRYNLETNKLKDQIFENEVIQNALEKEVCHLIYIHIFLFDYKLFIIKMCYLFTLNLIFTYFKNKVTLYD